MRSTGSGRQEALSKDCDKRPHDPQPVRNWLPPFGSQQPGDLPILAVGRTKGDTFPIPDNDTNSPQDIAWLTLMDRATSHIHVESPNINDNAFRAAVVRAVGRGVTVRLLTSLGFNDVAADLPSRARDNLEVVGNLRKEIRVRSFPRAMTSSTSSCAGTARTGSTRSQATEIGQTIRST